MPATLTLSGKKFVVLSEGEYLLLKRRADKTSARVRSTSQRAASQEAGDIAESQRRLKESKRIPAEAVFKRLGA
jgi:hypothetical protein